MKKFILIVPIFLIVASCSVSKELKQERKIWNFKNWKQEYKDRAFCLCVLKGFENKKIEKELIKNDKSFFNPLGIAIFDESLAPVINDEIQKIRIDSINSIGKYPDDLKALYNKREVSNHCLRFYHSKKLDSLAEKQKNKWKKINSIIDKIHEKLPTY